MRAWCPVATPFRLFRYTPKLSFFLLLHDVHRRGRLPLGKWPGGSLRRTATRVQLKESGAGPSSVFPALGAALFATTPRYIFWSTSPSWRTHQTPKWTCRNRRRSTLRSYCTQATSRLGRQMSYMPDVRIRGEETHPIPLHSGTTRNSRDQVCSHRRLAKD